MCVASFVTNSPIVTAMGQCVALSVSSTMPDLKQVITILNHNRSTMKSSGPRLSPCMTLGNVRDLQ